jgi:hypothetical protein
LLSTADQKKLCPCRVWVLQNILVDEVKTMRPTKTFCSGLVAALMGVAVCTGAHAVPFTLSQTFSDPTPTPGFFSVFSVALSGNNVLIGDRDDDTNGSDVGQAHLFDATTGSPLQTFNDPTPTSGDWFGSSVSLSGNNVLIGAHRDDTNGNDVGQVHLFDATTGNLLQTFNDPTPTGSDAFGSSVSLSGNNVLIGALGDDTNGGNAGQAHLFDATTGNLLQTFNDPTPTGFELFGFSAALSDDKVLLTARMNDTTNGSNVGQAHLYTVADSGTAVPEPGVLAVFGMGLAGLAAMRRKRMVRV